MVERSAFVFFLLVGLTAAVPQPLPTAKEVSPLAAFKAALRRHEGEVASMSFWKSDLELDLDRDLPESEGGRVDMLFIDTLHVYGQVSQLVHAPVVPSLLLSRMHSFTHSCTH